MSRELTAELSRLFEIEAWFKFDYHVEVDHSVEFDAGGWAELVNLLTSAETAAACARMTAALTALRK